jgi:hypothetical protein
MITLSYPHEKVPWAALPTKAPFILEFSKFILLLVYSETFLSTYVISYFNILILVLLIVVSYQRLTSALVFNNTIYVIQIIQESMLISVFLFASLCDFVRIDRNVIFHLIMAFSVNLLLTYI